MKAVQPPSESIANIVQTNDNDKLSESSDYQIASSQPYYPQIQGVPQMNLNQSQTESDQLYPLQLEGVVDDYQLTTTNGLLPTSLLSGDGDDDDQKGTDTIMDDMIDSEDSAEMTPQPETNANETIMGSVDDNEMVKFKEDIVQQQLQTEEDENDLISNKNGAITLIGNAENEKIKFKKYTTPPKTDHRNGGQAPKLAAITLMGSTPGQNDEDTKQNENELDMNIDAYGDVIPAMNANNANITMMGMNPNEKVSFKHTNSNANNVLRDNGEVNEQDYDVKSEQYVDEGQKEKNSVLTDLQNVKDQIVNALPDPNISYEHPSHPMNNEKGVYNYADNMISLYDDSSSMKLSMDNTYNKRKKKLSKPNKANRKKRILQNREQMGAFSSLMPQSNERIPQRRKKQLRPKRKSKPMDKKELELNKQRRMKKKPKRWQSFIKRNGL